MHIIIIHGLLKDNNLKHIEYAIIDNNFKIIEEKIYSENTKLTKKHLLYKHINEKNIIVNDKKVIDYLFDLYDINKKYETFEDYECKTKIKIESFLKIYKKNINHKDDMKKTDDIKKNILLNDNTKNKITDINDNINSINSNDINDFNSINSDDINDDINSINSDSIKKSDCIKETIFLDGNRKNKINDNIKPIIDDINDDIDSINNDENIINEQMKILYDTINTITNIKIKKKNKENTIIQKINELEKKIEILLKKNIMDENNFKIISFEKLDKQISILENDKIKFKEKEDRIIKLTEENKKYNETNNAMDKELNKLTTEKEELIKKNKKIIFLNDHNKNLIDTYTENILINKKYLIELDDKISEFESDNLELNKKNNILSSLIKENDKLKEKEKMMENLINENKRMEEIDIKLNELTIENIKLNEKENELTCLLEDNRKLKKNDFDLFEIKLSFKNSKISLNLFLDKTMIYNVNDLLNYIKNKYDEEFVSKCIFVNDIEWLLIKLFKRNDELFNYVKHDSYIICDKINNDHANITILNLNIKLLKKIKNDHRNEVNMLNSKYIKLLENSNHDPIICIVCSQELRNCIIIPCNHVCICKKCYNNNNLKKCPICRIDIFEIQDIYIS